MVNYERFPKRPKVDTTPSDQFQLIEIRIQSPHDELVDASKVFARPYEFEDNKATKFVTTCSHCGQGFSFFAIETVKSAGNQFIGCPNCNAGSTFIPPIESPFVNPVDIGLIGFDELDQRFNLDNLVSE